MSCKRLFHVFVVTTGVFVAAASAQVVSPPTPRGFVSRPVGDSQNINANISVLQQPQQASPALIKTLRMRIDGLMRQRRYDEAEAAAMDLLQRSPNDEHAIGYLRLIQSARLALEVPLQKMIVPKIEFREATLSDVLAFLHKMSGDLSADKKPVSFVFHAPPGTAIPTVTLSLHQVPMLDVLRYVTATTGLAYKIEPHAVIIYKQQAPPTAPVGPATP
ncbi:MAG: STN domain-containing protein [Verrucomicrobia bacterium]|nr:STN domain-containing protein [Verrucomicrobiota bacterium]